MSTTQILVLIVVLLLLLFAISRYFTKQEYRSKGGAPFILYKSDIEKIYNAIYDNSISLKDYGLDDDDKTNIIGTFDDIKKTIIESRRNLGILAKSLNTMKDKKEQLNALEQQSNKIYNKKLTSDAFKSLKDKYTMIKQNEKKASEFHKKKQLKTAFDALKEARINKETNIIDEAKEGIEYESRECHIHKHKVVEESSSELGYSLSFELDEYLPVLETNIIKEPEKVQDELRVNQPTINPIEQQTEDNENENPVNEERANEEEEIAEVSKNETINIDDNNEAPMESIDKQHFAEAPMNPVDEQQNTEAPMNPVDEQQNTEAPMNPVDEQQNTKEPDLLGGRGLSIYNYGFLEAYIHFKRIEGIKLEKIKTQMKYDILVIQCTGNYMLVIIPVEQQFDVPFDWRRKEHIKKTSICTSFDIYRAKDRASVEWCIYKDVNGQTDFTTYLYRLQNPNPVSYESISVNDDSSDTDM